MWLELTFPAGRVHATPWGRHVNEGAIEYPPSPWRLLRAFIATGFAKLHWTDVPEVARGLLDKLASAVPSYRIATEVPTAHTRHYMPDYRDDRDKVFDAFAVVPRSTPSVAVQWDVGLDDEERALFEQLAAHLGYLGRAEAWADGRVVADPPLGLTLCEATDTPPGPGYEEVRLLAPLSAAELARWVERAGAARSPKERKALPASIVEVLSANTTALQKEGWSQPPGTRWLTYWRPVETLVARPEATATPRIASASVQTTALLAVASDTRQGERYPSMTTALWRGESIHDALVSRAQKLANGVPSCLTGKDANGAPLTGHRHVHVIPLDLRARGDAALDARIDHFLLHAPGGFDEVALRAVAAVRKTYAKDLPDLFLTLIGSGQLEDFAGQVPHCGAYKTWVSSTPFVPPRHLKPRGRDALAGQVARECDNRGLPIPKVIEVEVEGHRYLPATEFAALYAPLRSYDMVPVEEQLAARWRHYKRERHKAGRPPPQSLAVGLRLQFEEPVRGPITLGYGSHLGLGVFEPSDLA